MKKRTGYNKKYRIRTNKNTTNTKTNGTTNNEQRTNKKTQQILHT